MRWSSFDLTIRQCLLEFGGAGVGDLRVEEAQLFKLLQSLKVHQPSVGDLSMAEVQGMKLRQSLQVNQPRVGSLCVARLESRFPSVPEDVPTPRR